MAPTQINSSPPPLVASLMPACKAEPLDAGSQSIPLAPSIPLPKVLTSNGTGKVADASTKPDSQLARLSTSTGTDSKAKQQHTGSAIPAAEDGIHIDVPWVNAEAEATRHQFSPAKVTTPRGLAAIQVPKPPSADRLKELASPRVLVSAPSPSASSPFYTGLGPGASPNTFTELANQSSFMGSTSEHAQKPARKQQQAGVHTAFGSRVRPTPPTPFQKNKTPPRHNSDSGVARTANYCSNTAASSARSKSARRKSSDATASTTTRSSTSSIAAAKSSKTRSSFGSSAPTGRAAVTPSRSVSRSAQTQAQTHAQQMHASKTPEATPPHTDRARSPPASTCSLNAENSTMVTNGVDTQALHLAPSEPLTAAAAATAAAGNSSSTQATSVPTNAQANLAAHSASTEASVSGPQRIKSGSVAQTEGSSPVGKASGHTATNATSAAFTPAADTSNTTPNKHPSGTISTSEQSPQPSALPGLKHQPRGGSPGGPRTPPKLKKTTSSVRSKTPRRESHTLQGTSSSTVASGSNSFALEQSGQTEQADSSYALAPMPMIASVQGFVADDKPPVSVESVEIGAHGSRPKRSGSSAATARTEATRDSLAIASKTLEGTAEDKFAPPTAGASQRSSSANAGASASAPKKPSFGMRLCGMLFCGAKGAVKDDDSKDLRDQQLSPNGHSSALSAENTGHIEQPIKPRSGMSPPQSLAPSPVPRLPVPGSGNVPKSTKSNRGSNKQASSASGAAHGTGGKAPVSSTSSTGAAKDSNKLQPQLMRKASNTSVSETKPKTPTGKTQGAAARGKNTSSSAAVSAAPMQNGATPKGKKTSRGEGSLTTKTQKVRPEEGDVKQAQSPDGSDLRLQAPHSLLSTAGDGCLESILTTTGNRTPEQSMGIPTGTPDPTKQPLFNTDDGVQSSAHAAMSVAQQSLFSTVDQGQQPMYNTVDGLHGTNNGANNNGANHGTHDQLQGHYGAGSPPAAPLMDSETAMAASMLPKITGESQGVIEATMLGHATLPARVVF